MFAVLIRIRYSLWSFQLIHLSWGPTRDAMHVACMQPSYDDMQSARMSKIKNGGLDQYGSEPFEQQQFGTAGVEGVKHGRFSIRKYQNSFQGQKSGCRSIVVMAVTVCCWFACWCESLAAFFTARCDQLNFDVNSTLNGARQLLENKQRCVNLYSSSCRY